MELSTNNHQLNNTPVLRKNQSKPANLGNIAEHTIIEALPKPDLSDTLSYSSNNYSDMSDICASTTKPGWIGHKLGDRIIKSYKMIQNSSAATYRVTLEKEGNSDPQKSQNYIIKSFANEALYKREKKINKAIFGKVGQFLAEIKTPEEFSKETPYVAKYCGSFNGKKQEKDEYKNYLLLAFECLPGGDLEKQNKRRQFAITALKKAPKQLEIFGLDQNKIAENQNNYARSKILEILKVVQAIDAIHKKGIIHRDIKPQNVVLDSKQNPILIDFGHSIKAGDISDIRSAIISNRYCAPIEIFDALYETENTINCYFAEKGRPLRICLYKKLGNSKETLPDNEDNEFAQKTLDELKTKLKSILNPSYDIPGIAYLMIRNFFSETNSTHGIINDLFYRYNHTEYEKQKKNSKRLYSLIKGYGNKPIETNTFLKKYLGDHEEMIKSEETNLIIALNAELPKIARFSDEQIKFIQQMCLECLDANPKNRPSAGTLAKWLELFSEGNNDFEQVKTVTEQSDEKSSPNQKSDSLPNSQSSTNSDSSLNTEPEATTLENNKSKVISQSKQPCKANKIAERPTSKPKTESKISALKKYVTITNIVDWVKNQVNICKNQFKKLVSEHI